MIYEADKIKVKEFLAEHPNPSIRLATTMYDGYVVCIKPMRTICGAELMCSPKTKPSLMKLL